ncbi:unnamed protein product [Sphagnum balticum]
MKSTSTVGGVVVVALRRVLCILVLVVVVLVVSEPTTALVQGKPEDKSNRVEATRESTLQTVQNAVDKTGEVGEKIQYHTGQAAEAAKDTATAAGVKVSEATEAAKDTLLTAGQNTREGAKKGFDSSSRTLGSVGEKAGNAVGSAKESVLGNLAVENRDQNEGVYGTASKYYDTATDKSAQAAEAMKAAAAQAGEKVQSNAYQTADTSQNTIQDAGSTIYDSLAGAGEKISQAADATKVSTLKQESQTGDGSYWDIAKNSVAAAAAGSVGEKLGSAGEYANDKVNAASDSIKSTATRTKENLQDSQIIDSGSKDGYFQDTTDSINNAASKMGEKLESAGSQAAETVESSISSSNLTRFLYLITFATTYGSAVWMTFVSGVILSKSIPRQQFGFVQSRIFPLYLKFVAVGDVILLVLYSIMHPLRSTDSSGVWQLVNLLLLIIGTVFNVFILEPKTTKLFVERMKLEKEEGRGLDYNTRTSPLLQSGERKLDASKQQFKILHGYSTILNLASLAGLTLHAWHLAHHLAI